MYFPPYSPKLSPIEQFWALVESKLKRHSFLENETLSARLGDACDEVLISLCNWLCWSFKTSNYNCYNEVHF
jgi:transposase